MPTLTDYVDAATLQRLQDIVSKVTGAQIRLYGADGQPVTQASVDMDSPAQMLDGEAPPHIALNIDGEQVGRIILEKPVETCWPRDRIIALAGALDLPADKLRQVLDSVGLSGSQADLAARQMLVLTADLIRRLCEQERQLRDRIEELTTMYRLTASLRHNSTLIACWMLWSRPWWRSRA